MCSLTISCSSMNALDHAAEYSPIVKHKIFKNDLENIIPYQSIKEKKKERKKKKTLLISCRLGRGAVR